MAWCRERAGVSCARRLGARLVVVFLSTGMRLGYVRLCSCERVRLLLFIGPNLLQRAVAQRACNPAKKVRSQNRAAGEGMPGCM